MKAKFIGQIDGTGFVNGKVYNIKTICRLVGNMSCLCVYDAEYNRRWCPYSRLETMLENWEILSLK
jgi:hypothetical protein